MRFQNFLTPRPPLHHCNLQQNKWIPTPPAPEYCRYGNLWRFSTARLESRGARAKVVLRRQVSRRKRAANGGTAKVKHIAKKRRSKKKKTTLAVEVPVETESRPYVQGYNSSDTAQLLGMLALREERALGAGRRVSSQLCKMGKLQVERKMRLVCSGAMRVQTRGAARAHLPVAPPCCGARWVNASSSPSALLMCIPMGTNMTILTIK